MLLRFLQAANACTTRHGSSFLTIGFSDFSNPLHRWKLVTGFWGCSKELTNLKSLTSTDIFPYQVNYVLNTLFSLHMVIAFLLAIVLDNTVPGSRQERGVYMWSEPEVAKREPAVSKDYELPFRVGRVFRWVKWVGL